MKIKHKARFRGSISAVGKAYLPPVLKVLGAVDALTQAGSMMAGEYNMQSMTCGPGQMSSNMC